MMVVFVMLHLLHPLSQSLQLQSQAGNLLVSPLPGIHLPLLSPALLHCDGLVRLDLVVITKQHLEWSLILESWIYVKDCLSKGNLEPEPVDDLQATDEREAGEEAHHAAHPGDLVRQ